MAPIAMDEQSPASPSTPPQGAGLHPRSLLNTPDDPSLSPILASPRFIVPNRSVSPTSPVQPIDSPAESPTLTSIATATDLQPSEGIVTAIANIETHSTKIDNNPKVPRCDACIDAHAKCSGKWQESGPCERCQKRNTKCVAWDYSKPQTETPKKAKLPAKKQALKEAGQPEDKHPLKRLRKRSGKSGLPRSKVPRCEECIRQHITCSGKDENSGPCEQCKKKGRECIPHDYSRPINRPDNKRRASRPDSDDSSVLTDTSDIASMLRAKSLPAHSGASSPRKRKLVGIDWEPSSSAPQLKRQKVISRARSPCNDIRRMFDDQSALEPFYRRPSSAKDRFKQHLTLNQGADCPWKAQETTNHYTDQRDQLDLLISALKKRRKIVVVAGAGISVSAGIPDFRSTDGLFRRLKSRHSLKSSGKDLFDASVYNDEESTAQFHDMVRNLAKECKKARPTPFHHFLNQLAVEGRLLRLYTQNVDGLDTGMDALQTMIPLPSKSPFPKTIQLHGGLSKMTCHRCNLIEDLQPDLFEGGEAPPCPHCELKNTNREASGQRRHGVGRLRPRMLLYNEWNPEEEAIGSCVTADLRTRPDAIIVVGTTLKVPGIRKVVKQMVKVVNDRKDGVAIWINHEPEPKGRDMADVTWDLVVKGSCDVIPQLLRDPSTPDSTTPDCRTPEPDDRSLSLELGERKNEIKGEIEVTEQDEFQDPSSESVSSDDDDTESFEEVNSSAADDVIRDQGSPYVQIEHSSRIEVYRTSPGESDMENDLPTSVEQSHGQEREPLPLALSPISSSSQNTPSKSQSVNIRDDESMRHEEPVVLLKPPPASDKPPPRKRTGTTLGVKANSTFKGVVEPFKPVKPHVQLADRTVLERAGLVGPIEADIGKQILAGMKHKLEDDAENTKRPELMKLED